MGVKCGTLLMKMKKEWEKLNAYAMKSSLGGYSITPSEICFARVLLHANEIHKDSDKPYSITEFCLGIKDRADKEFIKFLMNESFFKDIYITKQVSSARRWGLYIRTDVPFNQMIAAATAIRCSWEFPHYIRAWKRFVKFGVNKNLAMFLAHYIDAGDRFVRQGFFSAHHFIGSSVDLRDYLYIFENKKLNSYSKCFNEEVLERTPKDFGINTFATLPAKRIERFKNFPVDSLFHLEKTKNQWGVSFTKVDIKKSIPRIKKLEEILIG